MARGEAVEEGWGKVARATTDDTWTFTHVPVGQSVRVCILSEVPVKWSVHFLEQQKIRCVGEKCTLCVRRSKPVARFLLSLWDFDLRARVVMELGEATLLDIRSILNGRDSGRGLCLELFRAGRSKRSKITGRQLDGGVDLLRDEFGVGGEDEVELPRPQDLKRVLKVIIETQYEAKPARPVHGGGCSSEESVAPELVKKIEEIRRRQSGV